MTNIDNVKIGEHYLLPNGDTLEVMGINPFCPHGKSVVGLVIKGRTKGTAGSYQDWQLTPPTKKVWVNIYKQQQNSCWGYVGYEYESKNEADTAPSPDWLAIRVACIQIEVPA